MNNSFISKVSAERRVLNAVNTHTQKRQQLAGLSHLAIQAWARNAGKIAGPEVVSQLLQLAELCQSLSDRSHESFNQLDGALNERIEKHLNALKMAIISAEG